MTRRVAAVSGIIVWYVCGAAGVFAQATGPADVTPALPPAAAPAPPIASEPGTLQPSAAEPAPAPPANTPAAATAFPPAAPPSAATGEQISPPDNNPYVNAHGHRQRWTQADVARVRAALAAQRYEAARRAALYNREVETPGPRVYGDAGAAFMFGFDITNVFRHDVGFDRFDDGRVSTRVGFFASYDVLTLAPKVVLSVELGAGFEHDEAAGLIGSSSRAELASQTLHGGVDLRWDALKFLSPMLRARGGASLLQLDLHDPNQTFDTAHASSGFASLGGGILLHTPARTFESRGGHVASFGLGVLVEGGYALHSPVDFSLQTPSNPRNIPVVDATLGRLELSGPYVRTSLVVRF